MGNWKWADKILGKEEVYDDDIPYDASEETSVQAPAADSVRQTSGISGGSSSAAIEMKIIKPEKFEDVKGIADHLLSKRTVVLNLENVNKEAVRRIIDFLTGTTYAIEGTIKKVSLNTYVITPKNIDVSAELGDQGGSQKELF